MQCPICYHELNATDNQYTLDFLFSLWIRHVKFSEATLQEHYKQAPSTRLYQCPYCELGIFLPQIIGTPALYEELDKASSGMCYAQNKWEFDQALQDIRGLESVIDIGCGGGAFLTKAEQIVTEAIGTDNNQVAIESAKGKGLKVFGLDEQEKLKHRRGTFDAAVSFQVLEHVADPAHFIRESIEWIRPGGKLFLCVPNSKGILKHYHHDHYNLPPHHATHWSQRTFEVVAEVFDLTLEQVQFQPLVRDHYSLLANWWYDQFSGRNLATLFVRHTGGIVIKILARLLRLLPINQLPIRGHSIYVVFSKATLSSA